MIGVNENALFAASPRKAPEELAADCHAPVPDIDNRRVSATCVVGRRSGDSAGAADGGRRDHRVQPRELGRQWLSGGPGRERYPAVVAGAGRRGLGGVGHRRGAEFADRAAEPGGGTGGRLGDRPRPAARRADHGDLAQRRLLAGPVCQGPRTVPAGDEAARERQVKLEGGCESGARIRGGHRLEEPVHAGKVGAGGGDRRAVGGGGRAHVRPRGAYPTGGAAARHRSAVGAGEDHGQAGHPDADRDAAHAAAPELLAPDPGSAARAWRRRRYGLERTTSGRTARAIRRC